MSEKPLSPGLCSPRNPTSPCDCTAGKPWTAGARRRMKFNLHCMGLLAYKKHGSSFCSSLLYSAFISRLLSVKRPIRCCSIATQSGNRLTSYERGVVATRRLWVRSFALSSRPLRTSSNRELDGSPEALGSSTGEAKVQVHRPLGTDRIAMLSYSRWSISYSISL